MLISTLPTAIWMTLRELGTVKEDMEDLKKVRHLEIEEGGKMNSYSREILLDMGEDFAQQSEF